MRSIATRCLVTPHARPQVKKLLDANVTYCLLGDDSKYECSSDAAVTQQGRSSDVTVT